MSENKTFEQLAPSWEAACQIYFMALSSDSTPEAVKREARADILNLARFADKVIAERTAAKAQEQDK